jgi:hypothetical protein
MAYTDGGVTALINEDPSAEFGRGKHTIAYYINQVVPYTVIDEITGLPVERNEIIGRADTTRKTRPGNLRTTALDHFLACEMESLCKQCGITPLPYFNNLPPLDPNPS